MPIRTSWTTLDNHYDNRDNGALSKLDVSSNKLSGRHAKDRKYAYDYSGLRALMKSITHLKELNIASNNILAEGAVVVAEDTKDNGALSKLDIQNNNIDEERKAEIQQICDSKSVTCLL